MRDPARIDRILALLGEAWKQSPDLRLGQIVFNLSHEELNRGSIFYFEDDDMEKALKKWIKRRKP